MRFIFQRPDSERHQGESERRVVIITGSCCIPGLGPIDEQACHLVERAIAETGVAARVQVMPATRAYFGGAPRAVMAHLMSLSNQGRLGLPAILIDGSAVSYGVPGLDELKRALLRAAGVSSDQA